MVLLIPTINYLTCISILNAYFGRSEIVFLKGQTFTRCIKNLVRIWKKYSWHFWCLITELERGNDCYQFLILWRSSHTVWKWVHVIQFSCAFCVLNKKHLNIVKTEPSTNVFKCCLNQSLLYKTERNTVSEHPISPSMEWIISRQCLCVMLAVATWAVLKDGVSTVSSYSQQTKIHYSKTMCIFLISSFPQLEDEFRLGP